MCYFKNDNRNIDSINGNLMISRVKNILEKSNDAYYKMFNYRKNKSIMEFFSEKN